MRTPTLSIIVPCYNAETYIESCIGSILENEFNDFELLLIDDGSSNGSDYLKKFEEKDSRVRLIATENNGVSAARNRGIDEATGNWIVFIDADDMITSSYLSVLLSPIKKHPGVIFVHGGCQNLYPDKHTSIEQKYSNHLFKKEELKHLFNISRGLIVSKLFSRGIINAGNLRFDNRMKIGEDYVFTLEYLALIKKLNLTCDDTIAATVDTVGYLYRRHQKSSTSSKVLDYQQSLYEFKKTSDTLFRTAESLGLSQVDLKFRTTQLGRQLFSTVMEMYRQNFPRAKRLEQLKSDFTDIEYTSIDQSSFDVFKRLPALLLNKRHFASFDLITSMFLMISKLRQC